MKTKISRRDPLKTLKCILLLALMPASLASAQSIPIPNLCGTGRNPACNGVQPIGSVDAHWNLATPYPSSASGLPLPQPPPLLIYGPAYVNTISEWLENGDTQWITPQVTNNPGGNYVYETTFNIPSGYNPATATITGWWSSDNEGIAAWLNDTQLIGFPVPGPSGFNAMTDFTIAHGVAGATFRPGLNRLFFQVRNRGFLGVDSNPTPTGLRVQFNESSVLPMGNYPDRTLLLSGDTTIAPSSTLSNATEINVSTSTNFKGLLEGNPMTGVVRVTNAHPAGIYSVTVTALNGGGVTAQTAFTLTVTTPSCRPADPVSFARTRFPAGDPSGASPRSVAIGDFDGDGIQDLAIASRLTPVPFSQSWVAVLLGKGTGGQGEGSFRPAGNFFIGTAGSNATPNSVAVGDFDGDGLQDIATANSGSNDASVLLNRTTTPGSLVFLDATNHAVGGQPRSIAVGDFDHDFKQDLAVTNEITNSVSVLFGDGVGNFPTSYTFFYPVGVFPYWVGVGDFEPNNRPDLAVAIRADGSTPGQVSVLLNSPSGQVVFDPRPFVEVPGDPLSVAVGDFDGPGGNGNGVQDLATANQPFMGNGSVSVLSGLGGGTGNFGAPASVFFPVGFFPDSLAVGDFNNDTRQDLAVASQRPSQPGRVSILLNNLGVGFSPPLHFGVGIDPSSVAVGDFNSDGRHDLAVANFNSNDVSIMLRRPCPCGATFSENFDGVTPPSLPQGWTAANDPPSGSLWGTSNIDPDTVPNDAFASSPAVVSDKSLYTPPIVINSPSAQLSFRNNYCMENTFDGGVLEISINGGPFNDITNPAVGGTFVSGGYNATINPSFESPIAGRLAWSGTSCCYICTVVDLGPIVTGQTVQFRFRMGSDSSVASTGWRIDKVQISDGNGTICCSTGPVATLIGSISTRLRVGTGDNVGIGGFIILGTEPKQVLLRAIGPSLAQFGVPDPLADPVLELHGPSGFASITNNNWRDTQEADIQATGIPPTNDLESAIVATLDPGAYSAVLRGNNNTSGVALVEIYDLDLAAHSTLANISTRALIGAADNIAIAGFNVLNGDFDRLVLRGIGPSLGGFGVSNPLANPTLELRDGNGALLVANDDWQDDPAQAAEITAAGLAPTNNLESGISVAVPPGLYTALLAGLNNGTGVGLVEVYDLDATAFIETASEVCQ